tara:strand:- start:573 stop:1622 length:1050 start_codon:yes stop_codon:yes gene_type:complete
VTVPTPIKKNKKPDLNPLIKATQSISAILKKNDVIIYESTMYPGLTEEVLVPIIEKKSKLKLNKDFSVGYSPERISPGLKSKSLTKITKIISASNTKTLIFMREIYGKIIKTGLHEAPNIRTAEAAKILENMQRDLNISLINEASIIFDKLKIKTYDVLKAAKTKWNFIDIEPGLVGGHCISIDPYYLKYKAEKIGYSPKIITSGRYINEKMASYVSKKIINLFKSRKKIENKNLNIGILGLSFKENCSDIRNSQVFKIIKFFSKKKVKLQLVDPWVLKKDLKDSNFQHLYVSKFTKKLDCLIITIKHKQFLKLKSGYFNRIMKKNSFIFDLKNILENIKLKKIKVISL